MSLDNEAVRLAYLGKANKRANEQTLNVPLARRRIFGKGKHKEILEEDEMEGGMYGRTRMVGGAKKRGRPKKQTQKDKEDEKLAMEVKELQDEEMEGGMYGGAMTGGAMTAKEKKAMEGGAKNKKMTKAQMKKLAKEMGIDYGKNVAEMDDEARELVGAGFFSDFGKGFVDGLKMVGSVAKPVLSVIPHPAAQAAAVGLDAVGLGKGRKQRAKASANDKRKLRGQMISKLMKKHGMTLGEASRHIKEKNLM